MAIFVRLAKKMASDMCKLMSAVWHLGGWHKKHEPISIFAIPRSWSEAEILQRKTVPVVSIAESFAKMRNEHKKHEPLSIFAISRSNEKDT